MHLGPTLILDSFAEAFRMRYLRVIVTAHDDYWLDGALRESTGYASSVIGCDAEVGVERMLPATETPDGRPGAAVLMFGFSTDALAKSAIQRIGQCVMTCPTTAVFNGLPASSEKIPLGKHLRYFGDGFQNFRKNHGYAVALSKAPGAFEQSNKVVRNLGDFWHNMALSLNMRATAYRGHYYEAYSGLPKFYSSEEKLNTINQIIYSMSYYKEDNLWKSYDHRKNYPLTSFSYE